MKCARRSAALAWAGMLLLSSLSCGGGSSHSTNRVPASNAQTIAVNGGPQGNYANGLFTTVTVCVPGSSNCQSVSGVLVDTGSFGLRLLSSAVSTVSPSLPQQKDATGNSIFECAQFVDSVVWGPVKTADVSISGEKAISLPIQLINTNTTPVPAGCKAMGPAEEDLSSLGANGILGIGFFNQDCGTACSVVGSSNPGFYYSCSGASCQITAQNPSLQVQNPVGFFAEDNNGVVLQLPSTASAARLTGTLTFGIGTKDNNALTGQQIFRPDNFGNLKTSFKGQTYAGFIDSGSNGYFFLDSATTGLANCSSSEKGFYCPSSTVSLSVTNTSGTSSNTVEFTIDNASDLFATNSAVAFPTLGGPDPAAFDWGLPFFFGRTIYVAIQGRQTSAGSGPFWAY
jgi:hypothetical protein